MSKPTQVSVPALLDELQAKADHAQAVSTAWSVRPDSTISERADGRASGLLAAKSIVAEWAKQFSSP